MAILALIVAAFLQYRVRHRLVEAKETLTLYLQERRTARPTSVALLKEINDVTTLKHIAPDGTLHRYLNDDLNPDQVRLLQLAGYDSWIFVQPFAPG